MSHPKFITIGGRRYLWTEILQIRREQMLAYAVAKQPALFEAYVDYRTPTERTAAGRYLEPSLFSPSDAEG